MRAPRSLPGVRGRLLPTAGPNLFPKPFNKLHFVVNYSWDDPEGQDNITRITQEELWVQLCKNLHIFFQFRQWKQDQGVGVDAKTNTSSVWVKYNLF